ncbi:hypothetical protein ACIPM2_07310 [Streptomyces sp. NPDC086081]
MITADGTGFSARAVVVATGVGAAAKLVSGLDVPAHRTGHHVKPV